MRSILLALALLAAPLPAAALNVVADIRPVHALTASVMGDTGAPVLLFDAAPRTALSPAQAQALGQADLVIWTGEALAPPLAAALSAPGAPPALPLLDLARMPVRFQGLAAFIADDPPRIGPATTMADLLPGHDHDHDHGQDHDHDHGADHDHDHAGASGHDDHGHDHGPDNPYLWLDPENARWLADVIALQLSALDPANAEAYRANAETAKTRIATLALALGDTLAPARGTVMVAEGEAEGLRYLLLRYNLRMGDPGAVNDSDEGGGRLPCQLLAPGQTGAASGVTQRRVDPYGMAHPPGPALYGALMRDLAETVASCADG